MIEYPCVQMSPDWWELRRGRPTASEFDQIISPVKERRSASTPRYIGKLVISCSPLFKPDAMTEQPSNPGMRHGIDCEPEAREFYEMYTGLKTRQVGLCTTPCGRFGMSPDALVVGARGGVEIKCPFEADIHEGYLKAKVLPRAYKCQVHGQLWVGGLEYVDFLSYRREHDPFLIRVYPDEFTKKLGAALEEFWTEYTATLAEIYKRPFKDWLDVESLYRR